MMETEFVAASEVAREMLGLREMLREVGLEPALPMQLHVTNQPAISQIVGEASSLKSKHVDVRLQFLCDSRVAVSSWQATCGRRRCPRTS